MTESAGLLQRLRGAAGMTIHSTTPLSHLLSATDTDQLREQMRSCLEARGGEVSALRACCGLGRTYLELDRKGQQFLKTLAEDFGVDDDQVSSELAALQEIEPHERETAYSSLRLALEPGRLKLLTQFNGLPEGVKFLVDLRADLSRLTKNAAFRSLDGDLRRLFASWFDIGFLELRRIRWNHPQVFLKN